MIVISNRDVRGDTPGMRRCLLVSLAVLLLAGCQADADPEVGRPPEGTAPVATTRAPADPAVFSPAPESSLEAAGSEFDSPADLAGWRINPGESLDDGEAADATVTVVDGSLQLVPGRSQWLNRHHGLGVGREIRGDVMVTARLLATGLTNPSSATDWSLSGIMLRAPLTAAGAEEWVHLSTGFVRGPVLERKQTLLGNSELTTFTVPPGWVELRLVRNGPAVAALHRSPGEAWTLDYTYAETRLPDQVELLLTGQTGAEGGAADLIGHVDWVHVAASPLSGATATALAAGTADPETVLSELPD